MPRRALVAYAFALALLPLACTRPNPGFCCLSTASCQEGGASAITTCTDPARPFCTDETSTDGPKWSCIADPMSMPCAQPSDCTNPDRPICLDQRCVQCNVDTDCGAATPVCNTTTHLCDLCTSDDDCTARTDTPHCSMSTGACVACVDSTQCTDASAPICDDTTNVCRGCAMDAECPSNVCDVSGGACIDEADVIYLAPTGQTTGTCTKAAPCSTFALGLAQVTGARDVIKAAAGTYTGQVLLDGVTVTIYAAGATATVSATNQSVVVVSNGADATIDGLTVEGAGGTASPAGVQCSPGAGSPPTLRLRGATIQSNGGAGISATNCDLTASQSTIKGNGGGGISLASSTYSLINDFIVGNGSATSTFGGIEISSVATAGTHDFEFNTVTGNTGVSGANTGVDCVNIFVALSIADSIVYGNSVANGGVQVGGDSDCGATFSDVGPQAASGTGDINMAPVFANASGGDFHLQGNSPGIDVADPAATVHVDVDGDTRPQGGGYEMGADEVAP